jgi:hypothetical protein
MIDQSAAGRLGTFVGLSLAAFVITMQPGIAADAMPEAIPPGGGAPAALPCVEVQIGSDRAGRLDCLNQQFRRAAEERPITPTSPYSTSSPPTEIGLFNETAERERLGNAFGHSAEPQRPPR